MKREIRVTRAGFLYVDGKFVTLPAGSLLKVSTKRITPFYVGQGQNVLNQNEQEIARK
jgi:hypothetical protein